MGEWDVVSQEKTSAPKEDWSVVSHAPVAPSGGDDVPQWGRDNPNLYGAASAAKAVGVAGIEIGGAALGQFVSPVPLLGAAAGYAATRQILQKAGVISDADKMKDFGLGLAGEAVPVLAKGAKLIGEKALPTATAFLADTPVGRNMLSNAKNIAANKLTTAEKLAGSQLKTELPKDGFQQAQMDKNIAEAKELEDTIKNLKFSLGAQTDATGIKRGQKALANRNDTAAAALDENNATNNMAIRDYIGKGVDTKGKSVYDTLGELSKKRDALLDQNKQIQASIDSQSEALKNKAEGHAEKYAASPEKDETGQQIREVAGKKKAELRTKSNDLWGAIPTDTKIDTVEPLKYGLLGVLKEHPEGMQSLYDSADSTSKQILDKVFKQAPSGSAPSSGTAAVLEDIKSIVDQSRPVKKLGSYTEESGVEKSLLPKHLREEGITRTGAGNTIELIDKKLAGKELTAKQQDHLDNLVELHRRSMHLDHEPMSAGDLSKGDRVSIGGEGFTVSGKEPGGLPWETKTTLRNDSGALHELTGDDNINIDFGSHRKVVNKGGGETQVEAPTVGELREIEKYLNRESARLGATNAPGSFDLARRLRDVKSAINESIYAYGKKTGDTTVANAIDKAKAFTRDEMAPLLRADNSPTRKVLAVDSSGSPKIPDEATGKEFLPVGDKGISAAKNYQAMGGSQEAIHGYAGKDLFDSAYSKDSGWNATTAKAWLNSHAPALKGHGLYDEFSGAVADISRAANLKKTLGPDFEKLAASQEKINAFNKSSAGNMLDGDVKSAVDNAMKGTKGSVGKAMQGLYDEVKGDDSAVQGLREAVKKFFIEKWQTGNLDAAGNINLAAGKADKSFGQLDSALNVIYSKEEMNVLDKARRALEVINRQKANVSGGGTSSETGTFIDKAEKVNTAMNLAATLTGKLPFTGYILNKTTKIVQRNIDNTLARAYFDPDYARKLLQVTSLADTKLSAADIVKKVWGPEALKTRATTGAIGGAAAVELNRRGQ